MRHLLRPRPSLLPFAVLLLLSACAGGGGGRSRDTDARYPGISCAPFARELTGVQLHGDADAWWDQADGRYRRAQQPATGALLVFRATGRLRSGHVSVVSRVVDSRTINVIQANWVHGELERDQLVLDVSDDNDWTLVRVWWPPIGTLGIHPYPTYGFILPDAPLAHDALARSAAAAAERAAGG